MNKRQKNIYIWKKWEMFIFVSLLIDFSQFVFKLFGKGTVKKKGICQLDELQFRDLMKGRSDGKWFEVIYCLPCSLPGLASRLGRKVKKKKKKIWNYAWCQNSSEDSHSATHAQCIKNKCNVGSVIVGRSSDLRMAYVISRVRGLTRWHLSCWAW